MQLLASKPQLLHKVSMLFHFVLNVKEFSQNVCEMLLVSFHVNELFQIYRGKKLLQFCGFYLSNIFLEHEKVTQ